MTTHISSIQELETITIGNAAQRESLPKVSIAALHNIPAIPLPSIPRASKSHKSLEYVSSLYGFTYTGEGGYEDKIFLLAKAYLSAILKELDTKKSIAEGSLYIAGVIKYLEQQKDSPSLTIHMDTLIGILLAYLLNDTKIDSLLAYRQDKLFQEVQTKSEEGLATLYPFSKELDTLDWETIFPQGKGLCIVWHKTGEAVAYYNSHIAGIRLATGEYRVVTDTKIPKKTKGQIRKAFKSPKEALTTQPLQEDF